MLSISISFLLSLDFWVFLWVNTDWIINSVCVIMSVAARERTGLCVNTNHEPILGNAEGKYFSTFHLLLNVTLPTIFLPSVFFEGLFIFYKQSYIYSGLDKVGIRLGFRNRVLASGSVCRLIGCCSLCWWDQNTRAQVFSV